MSESFVHLHVHTQYSLLEGAIRISELLDRVQKWNMPAVAMTDTNQMFGAMDFYLAAKKKNIQPILGCEIWFTSGSCYELFHQKEKERKQKKQRFESELFHLVLLCKNKEGYVHLCQLLTKAYQGTYASKSLYAGKAVIDFALFKEHAEGLIVLSGCLRGEIPYLLLKNQEKKALALIKKFQTLCGEDFYLELQDHAIPEQEKINRLLYDLGKRFGIRCVGTSDCHYLDPEDAEVQEVLQCIEKGKRLNWNRPASLVPSDFYFKPPEKMRENFQTYPGVADESLEIAKKCQLEFRFQEESGKTIYHLPSFCPDHVSENKPFEINAYFREQAYQGLEKRFQEGAIPLEKRSVYEKRLEEELAMIIQTGFAGYFLIVADFINWAKVQKIPVGPGRGSGAGSLVAYALRITELDPIYFQLLFERFINPERVSMPDFDVDFCQERRSEVIQYVAKKYGKDHVCQIITFGKLQARAVIKDVARTLGLSFSEADQITKLLPDVLQVKIKDALKSEPQLQKRMKEDPRVEKVIHYAQKLEGLYRNPGMHAAGVLITKNPVLSYAPLYVTADGDTVIQFDKDFSEKIGLVKFDFLGLKTLTVMHHTVRLVHEGAPDGSDLKKFSIERINIRDARVFALITSGDTQGVFQLESSGMKDLCQRLKPSSLEELTAINALYRPGPLGSGMVDDFIERKHGRKPIVYELDCLESILKETYGVILYQEQVMQIARELAGYSLGQADMLRRAMGKKKPKEMARHKEIFLKGAIKKGIDAKKAETIFDLMAKFAQYGFNKSHSAAYALITYQTAYLKTYFTEEFLAAVMTTEMNHTEKLTKYLSDAKMHGIEVCPPDINTSHRVFSVEIQKSTHEDGEQLQRKAIRFGLEAIKGVGSAAVDSILETREKKGRFKNILDFSKRVLTRKVNKKVWEALVLSGTLDPISNIDRASLYASIENILKYASKQQKESELMQMSFFDQLDTEKLDWEVTQESVFVSTEKWSLSQKLIQEKKILSFYVSGHPMDRWQNICNHWLGWNIEKIERVKQETNIAWPSRILLGAMISQMKSITTRRGDPMAFVRLEDTYGGFETVVFPQSYQKYEALLKEGLQEAKVLLWGLEVQRKQGEVKFFLKTLQDLNQVYKKTSFALKICVSEEVAPERLRKLKSLFTQHSGNCRVLFQFSFAQGHVFLKLPPQFLVSKSPKVIESIEKAIGPKSVKLMSF